MTPETLLYEEQQAGATQEKSRSKGVEDEAKPTREAEQKDAKTPWKAEGVYMKHLAEEPAVASMHQIHRVA